MRGCRSALSEEVDTEPQHLGKSAEFSEKNLQEEQGGVTNPALAHFQHYPGDKEEQQ